MRIADPDVMLGAGGFEGDAVMAGVAEEAKALLSKVAASLAGESNG